MYHHRNTTHSPYRPSRYQNTPRNQGNFRVSRSQPRHEYINPALFVKRAVEPQDDVYTAVNSFSDFPLHQKIQDNIKIHGYLTPTPIQDQAIAHIINGKDLVGIANTGTGKTAAFLIPLINKAINDRSQKVLIVVPTRELAAQIEEEFRHFSIDIQINAALCIGGVGIHNQIRSLRGNPNFIIGTPGRLKDLEHQRALSFSMFNTIVLDEVDRMLDMGFINDVKHIVGRLPAQRHSLFFSATLPKSVVEVMTGFLKDPVTVSVKTNDAALYVDQDIVKVNGKQKVDILHDLLIKDGFNKVLVFGRTKWGMEKLAKELDRRGFNVASIHGNKTQFQRCRAIEQFKLSQIQILLATDIASRGLDIENVTHVINYDIPESYTDYVHRIGRTGRAGRKGIALTFVD